MSMGRKLRDLLRHKKFLITPGITTPLHAMIVEKAGFDFVEEKVRGSDGSVTTVGAVAPKLFRWLPARSTNPGYGKA